MGRLNAYYLFQSSAFPDNLPTQIHREIEALKSGSNNKEAYVKEAYDFITNHYESGRIRTLLRLFDLFSTNLEDLWNRRGFMHCTNQNYLLALLLVKGGFFKDSDIRRVWTLVGYYSPHQYLKVRIGDNHWIDVDCWARHYGVGYGGHAHGFNTTLSKTFVK